jgi:hypothetical protein
LLLGSSIGAAIALSVIWYDCTQRPA